MLLLIVVVIVVDRSPTLCCFFSVSLPHLCCVSNLGRYIRLFIVCCCAQNQLVITIVKQLLLPIGLSTTAVAETNEQQPHNNRKVTAMPQQL